jgi:Transposase Tn5 dimerisation domain
VKVPPPSTTHNPFDEIYRVSCLSEMFTSSSYGEGLEAGRDQAPRQSLTRQTFHKILKSGCKAEESRLRTAERLARLLALFCILSWRIFWLTMMNRSLPAASPTLAFTAREIYLLDRTVKEKVTEQPQRARLSAYLIKLARLGGYLARVGDSPPGNRVIWRGMSRLTDIELGFSIGAQLVGN